MSQTAFTKIFRDIVTEHTIPEGIPAAIPWVELEAKGHNITARTKRIRGKLNVPRERFRERSKGEYVWAGKK